MCVCVLLLVTFFKLLNGASLAILNFIYRFLDHEKIVDPYFFSCQSYVPLKTKFENLVCKISQKVFELEFIFGKLVGAIKKF